MKKIIVIMLFLLMCLPAWGIIAQLDSENADLDLTSLVTVLTHTPDASNPMLCQAYIELGYAPKTLDGTGGLFEFVMTIGGQTVQPSPEIVNFGTEVRASIWTSQFLAPENTVVILRVKSPNGADTDVEVQAYLYDVFPVNVASGVVESDVQLIEGGDATDALDTAADTVVLADGVTHGGSTALLDLKAFDVTNPDGTAVTFKSTSAGAHGLYAEGYGSGVGIFGQGGQTAGGGHGIKAQGNDSGHGFYATADSGNGMRLHTDSGYALYLDGDTGDIFADEINTLLSTIADIETDTDELQNDWADGGRLDQLLDATSTHAAADVWAVTMENTKSYAEVMRIIAAVLSGKSSYSSGQITFVGIDGSTDRLTVSVSGGLRSSVDLWHGSE